MVHRMSARESKKSASSDILRKGGTGKGGLGLEGVNMQMGHGGCGRGAQDIEKGAPTFLQRLQIAL